MVFFISCDYAKTNIYPVISLKSNLRVTPLNINICIFSINEFNSLSDTLVK